MSVLGRDSEKWGGENMVVYGGRATRILKYTRTREQGSSALKQIDDEVTIGTEGEYAFPVHPSDPKLRYNGFPEDEQDSDSSRMNPTDSSLNQWDYQNMQHKLSPEEQPWRTSIQNSPSSVTPTVQSLESIASSIASYDALRPSPHYDYWAQGTPQRQRGNSLSQHSDSVCSTFSPTVSCCQTDPGAATGRDPVDASAMGSAERPMKALNQDPLGELYDWSFHQPSGQRTIANRNLHSTDGVPNDTITVNVSHQRGKSNCSFRQVKHTPSSGNSDVCDGYFSKALKDVLGSFRLSKREGEYNFSRYVSDMHGSVRDIRFLDESNQPRKHSGRIQLGCLRPRSSATNSDQPLSQHYQTPGSCNCSTVRALYDEADKMQYDRNGDTPAQNGDRVYGKERRSSSDSSSLHDKIPLGHDGLSSAHRIRRRSDQAERIQELLAEKLPSQSQNDAQFRPDSSEHDDTNVADRHLGREVENAIAEAHRVSSEKQFISRRSQELELIPSVELKPGVSPHSIDVGQELMSYPIAIWEGVLDHEHIQFPSELLEITSFCKRHQSVCADVQYQDADCEGWDTRRLSVARQPLKMFLSHLKRCSEGLGPVLTVADDVSVESLATTPCGTSFVANPFYVAGNHADELDCKSILTKMKRYKNRHKEHIDEFYQQIQRRKINPKQSSLSAPYITPEMAVYWVLDELPKPPVRYCVNVDLDNQQEWGQELKVMKKHLPSWVWCRDELDIMSHIRQPVPGMNQPQIYLKTPGAWTGCHEENLRFHSVNICHGPDPSEWMAITEEYAPRLRELVWEEFEIDIYRNEGCYLPPVEFCRKHGIPVLRGVQNAGDMICLNGGTLHWVRSFGVSVHASWNIGPWQESTLRSACVRRSINNGITPPLPSLIPMQTLCLDLSRAVVDSLQSLDNFPNSRLPANVHNAVVHLTNYNPTGLRDLVARLQFELASSIEKEACYFSAGMRSLRPCQKEPPGSDVFRCQNNKCNAEIFLYYSFCETCANCIESEENGTQSFVAPAPGRTDGPIEVHSQFCVPSLEALPSGNKRRMEHPDSTINPYSLDGKQIDAFLRRRLKQHKRRKLNENTRHICSPIMCVPCGLSHSSRVQGEHKLHFLKKEELEEICKSYCQLVALWDRFSSKFSSP
eukprot:gb/GECG01015186.1/.p1 GENE.gb/GECG01015186.1/~~gb/GECG01015186.1/.p1  ORF type:complete len:1141 (+),score=108.89 gb/GECG01015186.1/:1-3423(+)